jgi:hypothetical protein
MRSSKAFLDGADGLEVVAELVIEFEQVSGVFAGEQGCVGGEAVHQAVAAGGGFAFGGFRPLRFLCVPAICIDS